MQRYSWLLMAVVLLWTLSPIQAMTVKQFLATAAKDGKILNHSEMVRYLESAPESTPYLERVEFRTRTEDFQLAKQRFSLKWYMQGWGETESREQVTNATKEINQSRQVVIFNRALKERYQALLQYLNTLEQKDLNLQLLQLYQDRLKVLHKHIRDEIFSMSEIIKTEDDIIDIQLELARLDNSVHSKEARLNTLAGSNKQQVTFPAPELIDIPAIQKMVKKDKLLLARQNIFFHNRAARLKLAESRYQLEKAGERNYLSFIRTSYDNEDRDQLRSAFFVEFGFNLPFINRDQEGINRRKLSYLREKLQMEESQQELAESIFSNRKALERLIIQHGILMERKKGGNAETSFKKYLSIEGIDPLTLLKLKESMIKGDLRLARITFRVRERYINHLSDLGKLVDKPLRNYLSPTMELLGP